MKAGAVLGPHADARWAGSRRAPCADLREGGETLSWLPGGHAPVNDAAPAWFRPLRWRARQPLQPQLCSWVEQRCGAVSVCTHEL
eukprot:4989838-Pyramimonas_sp.AAC.1